MSDLSNATSFELIYFIVNHGMGSKLLTKAKKFGVIGGTILYGSGTVSNSILNFLSLYDERKEIVLIGAESSIAEYAITNLNRKFQFDKPNHGIVFTVNVSMVSGSRLSMNQTTKGREVKKPMYQLITTIVNRGKAEDVVDAAYVVGSKGGTIIHARGSGVNESMKLFSMDIEPEKEVVLILSKVEITDKVVLSIREKVQLDKPGNGIIFIQDVISAYGVFE